MSETVSIFRILFLVAQKSRAARIAQWIREYAGSNPFVQSGIRIDYLPGVAVFRSYENEQGKRVRYLASVDYYGPDVTLEKPASLLPFFDQDSELPNANSPSNKDPVMLFAGISAVAVGAGLENDSDLSKIRAFLTSLSKKEIFLEAIPPNPEFNTMQEELDAFQKLEPNEKLEVSRLGILGPGKMAKFTIDFATRLIQERLDQNRTKSVVVETEQQITSEYIVDPTKFRYSCRKCRTILFGEDQLEDPPHLPALHQFSLKKKVSARPSSSSSCQSLFVQSGIPWMGDMSEMEGKLACPKCQTKVGTWHWSGAQCSCGTWVVPAIQIPKSRLDEIAPFQNLAYPSGTVICKLGVT